MTEITGGKSSQENLDTSTDRSETEDDEEEEIKENETNEKLPELTLLKMASLQSLSCKVLTDFMANTCLHRSDSDISDISNSVIQQALVDILGKIDEYEVKAKAFKPHFNILAMIGVGFARRNFLENSSTFVPIKSSVISPDFSLFFNSSNREEVRAFLSGNSSEETPIFEPLREMGFDSTLINEALRTLSLDGRDTSAQTINQCATWMIDHIESRPQLLRSSTGGASQDIRNFFPNSRNQTTTATLRRPVLSSAIVPPWVSSFQGSLTPIQTR